MQDPRDADCPPEREELLDEVIGDYLDALDRGEAPARHELLERHPELVTELAAFLEAKQHVEGLLDDGAGPSPEHTPTPHLRPGALFGDYEVLDEIARGGMGIVYRAMHRRLGRLVALKTVLAGGLASEEDRRRFRREAEAAARLDHPNIIPVYEVGEHDGASYFTMKLAEDGSLAAHQPRLAADLRAAARLVAKVARAVQYAHLHGVLHRDLKPSNIVLHQGQPFVTDFGLAKVLEGDAGLTLSGAVIGTPTYMAPEQARGAKDLGPPVDVYSLGAILYELLTCSPPFRRDARLETLRAVQEDEPARPSSLRPQVPRDLETIVLKCLEKDPRRRYSTAAGLAVDLELWLAGRPIEARRASRTERVWRWCLRNRAATAVLLLLVLLAAIATGAAWTLRRSELRATRSLWRAAYIQAKNAPYSPEVGHRTESLKAVAEAARIEPNLALRNVAVACLALGDIELAGSLEVPEGERLLAASLNAPARRGGGAASDTLEYVTVGPDGSPRRRAADGSELPLPVTPGVGAGGSLDGWYLSQGSRYFALRSRQGSRHRLQVWDFAAAEQGEPLVDVTGSPLAASFDGAGLLAVASGGHVVFATLGGADRDRAPEQLATGLTRLLGVEFHPRGRSLAVSGWHPDGFGRAQVWDLESRSLQMDFRLSQLLSTAGAVAWHPEGRILAVSDWVEIVLFDTTTASLLGDLRGHRGEVSRLAFTADGDVLASQGTDVAMRLWEVSSRSHLVTARSRFLGLGAGDRLLAAGDHDRRLESWRLVRRRARRTYRESDLWQVETSAVRFSADESLLALSGADAVKLVDVRSGREVGSLPARRSASADFLADGRLLTWGGDGLEARPIAFGADGTCRIGPAVSFGLAAPRSPAPASFDAKERLAVLTASASERHAVGLTAPGAPVPLDAAGAFGRAVASPDGRWAAAGPRQDGGEVLVWETESGKVLERLHVEGGAEVHFSPQGGRLLVGTAAEYRLHELPSFRLLWKAAREHRAGGAAPAAFLPTGGLLAIAPSDFHVRLVEVETAAEVCSLPPDPIPIASVGFSPSGRYLTVTRFNRVHLWDLALLRASLAELGLDWQEPPGVGRAAAREGEWKVVLEEDVAPAPGREGAHRVESEAVEPPRSDPARPLQELRWGTGWNTFVIYRAGGQDYLLAGKPATGDIAVHRLAGRCATHSGECIVSERAAGGVVARARWTRGWTSVLAYELDGAPMLLIYKPATGALQVHRLDDDGTVPAPIAAVRTEAAEGTATIFQDPQGASYLLAVRTATGEARVHPVQAAGRYAGAPVWLPRETRWWGPGWTHCRSYRYSPSGGSEPPAGTSEQRSFVFLYRRDVEPIARVHAVAPGGVLGEPVESEIGGGWTIAEPVVTNGGTTPARARPLLYLHRASTGESRFLELLPDGSAGAVVASESWDRGFDRALFFEPAGEGRPFRLLFNTESGYGRVDRLPEARGR